MWKGESSRMSDIADIFDGEFVQVWKDDHGDFQLRVLCATIRLDNNVTRETFRELKQAVSKTEDYFAGRSI